VLVVAAVGAGAYRVAYRNTTAAPPVATAPGPDADADVTPPYAPTVPPTFGANAPPAYPANGPGTYVFARGSSPIFGSAGPLRRFRVAVEAGGPVSVDEFTALVEATLSDPRSWIAGRDVRLRRVPGPRGGADFTIYLATPGTAYRLCRAGGLNIYSRGQPYTSCRVGGQVVINLARYLTAVPQYGAPLTTYRQYAINHEVGHALGHQHELCPASGRLAPVMQQQTFGLRGCLAYAWPYWRNHRYAGPTGEIVGG
jgi:hypothetical protein